MLRRAWYTHNFVLPGRADHTPCQHYGAASVPFGSSSTRHDNPVTIQPGSEPDVSTKENTRTHNQPQQQLIRYTYANTFDAPAACISTSEACEMARARQKQQCRFSSAPLLCVLTAHGDGGQAAATAAALTAASEPGERGGNADWWTLSSLATRTCPLCSGWVWVGWVLVRGHWSTAAAAVDRRRGRSH